jgi:hypothetical protein
MAMDDAVPLIAADEPVFHLDLTAAQLKVTHTALRALLDDFGHEEADVQDVVHSVLEKLPDEHEIRAIDLGSEIAKLRALREDGG